MRRHCRRCSAACLPPRRNSPLSTCTSFVHRPSPGSARQAATRSQHAPRQRRRRRRVAGLVGGEVLGAKEQQQHLHARLHGVACSGFSSSTTLCSNARVHPSITTRWQPEGRTCTAASVTSSPPPAASRPTAAENSAGCCCCTSAGVKMHPEPATGLSAIQASAHCSAATAAASGPVEVVEWWGAEQARVSSCKAAWRVCTRGKAEQRRRLHRTLVGCGPGGKQECNSDLPLPALAPSHTHARTSVARGKRRRRRRQRAAQRAEHLPGARQQHVDQRHAAHPVQPLCLLRQRRQQAQRQRRAAAPQQAQRTAGQVAGAAAAAGPRHRRQQGAQLAQHQVGGPPRPAQRILELGPAGAEEEGEVEAVARCCVDATPSHDPHTPTLPSTFVDPLIQQCCSGASVPDASTPPQPHTPAHRIESPSCVRSPPSSLDHSPRTLRTSSEAAKNCTSAGWPAVSRAKGTRHASGEPWKAVSHALACACASRLGGLYSTRTAAATSSGAVMVVPMRWCRAVGGYGVWQAPPAAAARRRWWGGDPGGWRVPRTASQGRARVMAARTSAGGAAAAQANSEKARPKRDRAPCCCKRQLTAT